MSMVVRCHCWMCPAQMLITAACSYALKRADFCSLVSHFLPVLSDRFSAESVFDALGTTMLLPGADPASPSIRFAGEIALADKANRYGDDQAGGVSDGSTGGGSDNEGDPQQPASGNSDDRGSTDPAPDAARRGVASLRTQRLAMLPQSALTYATFLKYVRALSRSMANDHAQWETLRAQLELDPDEILVRTEEFMHAEVAADMYGAFGCLKSICYNSACSVCVVWLCAAVTVSALTVHPVKTLLLASKVLVMTTARVALLQLAPWHMRLVRLTVVVRHTAS